MKSKTLQVKLLNFSLLGNMINLIMQSSHLKKLFLSPILFCLFFTKLCFAAQLPTGVWQTIDDETHKPRAQILIQIKEGTLTGTVLSVISQLGDTGKCEHCSGAFKNKPIKNLQVLWGLIQKNQTQWGNGYILDPKNGHIYRCQITLADNGNTLKVRGYIGFSLLGRTQYWYRIQ